MLKKVLAAVLAFTMLFTLLLTGCGSAQQAGNGQKKLKIGFVYVGPAGDGGWSQAHNDGRLAIEKEFGDKVETVMKESVPEGPECEKVMRDMIDQGCSVIFATSFGFMDYVTKVAKDHPEVKFFHCSGYQGAENVSTYFGRMYEARYLSGIVAGMKTKSNKIGYVAAMEIPEVIRGINAFTLGVRSVNPDAKVLVRWTHTWYDPAKEKDAAKALLDEGVDVMAQHQDTTGPQVAAEEKGVFAIGYNCDTRNAAPKAFLTAPLFHWGVYYTKQVKAILDGNWKASDYWGEMNEGIVSLAPLSDVAPAGAKEKVEDVQKKINDLSFKVFTGPIKDQTGAVKVPEGKVMTDKEMLSFNWFVEGVEGKIEKK